MAASTLDKFTDTYNAANPNVARVTSTRASGGSSLSCDNLAGWPTATKVHFSTYQINTSNNVIAGTQIDWYGIVSGNTIGSLTRITGATDNGSAVGDVVEMNPTASWGHDLYSGLTTSHNNDGTMITSLPLTTPKITTGLKDANGATWIGQTATASAVNYLSNANAATGGTPSLTATGADSNVDGLLIGKGTGSFRHAGPYDGWVAANETLTYASASTFTCSAALAAAMAVGDKVKLTQTTVKYFYITGISGTTITVTGGSDYTLANAAITAPYYSKMASPASFPQGFNEANGWKIGMNTWGKRVWTKSGTISGLSAATGVSFINGTVTSMPVGLTGTNLWSSSYVMTESLVLDGSSRHVIPHTIYDTGAGTAIGYGISNLFSGGTWTGSLHYNYHIEEA